MGSLSTERQQKILDLLQKKKALKTQELVKQLQVSPMTVHRDLHHLAEAGKVNKVHGGVTLVQAGAADGRHSEGCALCAKPVRAYTAFVIRTASGEQLTACCPHCGLLLLASQATDAIALTADFLYGQTVNARQAVYLVESSVEVCCSPTVLSFANLEDARRFQRGFGGRLMGIEQVMRYLQAAMVMEPLHRRLAEREHPAENDFGS